MFTVTTRNLTCYRGERRLFSGLDFSFGGGELLQVKGENGSGKTSLLRIMAGLSTPAEGAILWNGEPIGGLDDEYLGNMIYLGHLDGVKGDLTAGENLHTTAAMLTGGPVDAGVVSGAMYSFGLRGRELQPARSLSQGQRRRLGLCRLLLAERPLWILDEPFTALDVRGVEAVQAVVGRHLEGGGSVVITSHQPVEVRGFTCRKITLN